jgi:hypothetical protein
LATGTTGILLLMTTHATDAQVIVNRGFNPWTGMPYRSVVARNPWTGHVVHGGVTVDPWTGRTVRGARVVNPWTGHTVVGGPVVNPWTGQTHWVGGRRGWW